MSTLRELQQDERRIYRVVGMLGHRERVLAKGLTHKEAFAKQWELQMDPLLFGCAVFVDSAPETEEVAP